MHHSNFILIITLLVLQTLVNSMLQEMIGMQKRSKTAERNICSRSTACKYVICLRRNRNNTSCSFMPLLFDSNCVCQQGQICTINTDMSEAIPPFIYHYHCREPWQAIRHSST